MFLFKISHLLKDAVFIFQDEVGLVKTVLLDKKKSKREIQTLDNYFTKETTVYQFFKCLVELIMLFIMKKVNSWESCFNTISSLLLSTLRKIINCK